MSNSNKSFAFAALVSTIILGVAACAPAKEAASKPAVATTSVNETEGQVVLTGTFEGRSDHITTGRVSIVKTASGYVARLENDFSLDGAPAPTLGFGQDGFVAATEFTTLNKKDGFQLYDIPASINPADFNEFYVWCADFSVPLGVATLAAAN